MTTNKRSCRGEAIRGLKNDPINTRYIKNSAKCLICKQTIESKQRHDFVTCKCGNLSVDGGMYYLKRSIKHLDSYEDKSVVRHEK